jgi:hypothetical protein
VGVTGEYVWWPGRREVEEDLEEEMARYGTLENPYTVEYLDWLFAKHGFEEVVRYHGVNGLVPVDLEGRTVKEVAQHPASQFQTLTARRPGVPGHTGPTTADPAALTRATITVLDTRLDAARARVSLQVRLANVGQTAWLPRGRRKGYVTLALRQGDPGGPAFREALPRHPLSGPVLPGQEVVLDATFRLPDDSRKGPWHLDLVSENVFWFSARGTVPAEVRLESR